jgi:hypothetical protein
VTLNWSGAARITLGEERLYWLASHWGTFEALGATTHVLGAGDFGFVLRTRDGNVMKFTEEAAEANAVQFIEDIRADLQCAEGDCTGCLAGFPFVKSLWQLPSSFAGEDIRYLIVREDVQPLIESERDDWTDALTYETPRWGGRGLALVFGDEPYFRISSDFDALSDTPIMETDAPYVLYLKATKAYSRYKRNAEMRDLLNAYIDLALNQITNYAPVIGESLDTLWTNYGISIQDMHGHNVGHGRSNPCREKDDYVFYDYMIYNFADHEEPDVPFLQSNPARRPIPKRSRIPLLSI